VASGFYLWVPRRWSWQHVRSVTLFSGKLRGKARDFNWHNVIGFWSAVPLFIVVLTAMPISFPWANALVYRAVGEEPPQQGGRGSRPPPPPAPLGECVTVGYRLWALGRRAGPGLRPSTIAQGTPSNVEGGRAGTHRRLRKLLVHLRFPSAKKSAAPL
jgi:uncharacterized iron-regulated membrane protein